jgi:hypothetical protein
MMNASFQCLFLPQNYLAWNAGGGEKGTIKLKMHFNFIIYFAAFSRSDLRHSRW